MFFFIRMVSVFELVAFELVAVGFSLQGKGEGMKKYALISVTDKTGLDRIAVRLSQLGFGIISTGGTAKILKSAGLEVIEAGELSGYGEMLGGRVKTLSPPIFAGILARRDNIEDMRELEEKKIPLIDIVICNLYKFDKDAPNREELIDIGGVSLIRAAAKNSRFVSVLIDAGDYDGFISKLESADEKLLDEERKRLAVKAWAMIEEYDSRIASAFSDDSEKKIIRLSKHRSLRYGENPHQSADWWVLNGGHGLHEAVTKEGKELSYNNILDLSEAMALACDLGENAVAVIKHQNPCGAAKKKTVLESLQTAINSDSSSAYGGIVAINGLFDESLASILKGFFIEVIVARKFSEESLEILKKRKQLRVLEWPNPEFETFEMKSISGGVLTQTKDTKTVYLNEAELKVVSKREPTAEELSDLKIADTIAKHVKSNAIVLVKDGATVGIGAGQMNRSDSVKIAAMKAGERIQGSVMASDGFFPFSDGIENAAGVTAVIQPGGSIRDKEVISAADSLGIALCMTGVRHFKH